MQNSSNPYEPPQTELRPDSTENSHVAANLPLWGLAAIAALFGGLTTAGALYVINAGALRNGLSGSKLDLAVLCGAALSSVIWGISGSLQRNGSVGLFVTSLIAAISAALWVAIFGTDFNTLSAAACVGWPGGGLVASIFAYRSERLRRIATSQDSAGGQR